MRALVNRPSPALAHCELTFIGREAIDVARARAQHETYVAALRAFDVDVVELEINAGCPDGVFVEDVAVVLDEVAILTTMGTESRRQEVTEMREAIAQWREVVAMALPATLEGGDVLRVDRTLFAGLSSRTNCEGVEALRSIAAPLGYTVVPVRVPGALHLKTGITALDGETCVVNPRWVDTTPFADFRLVEVAPNEPWGANVLRLENGLIVNAGSPRTAGMIEHLGYRIERVDISEFGKAEAGLTCMSLLFSDGA